VSARESAPFEFLLGLLALVTIWALIAIAPPLPAAFAGLGAIATTLLFLPDGLDMLMRLYLRSRLVRGPSLGQEPAASTSFDVPDFSAHRKQLHLRQWAILLSVHDLAGEMQSFLTTVENYRDILWVIDDCSSDRTADLLEGAGVSCIRGTVNRHKPGAIQQLLEQLPPEIETVLVMDPDTRIVSDRATIEGLIFDFQRSGLAAMTPRIDVRKDGLVASLQRFEYFLALGLGRKSMGRFAVTSGVSFYRRRDLEFALHEHSLSVYAEDLETALILLAADRDCYYDDRVIFETEGMTTWSRIFSQRAGWAYGLARVYFSRLAEIRRIAGRGAFAFYQFVLYLGGLCLLGQPLRLIAGGVILLSLVSGFLELSGLGGAATQLIDTSQFLIFYGIYFAIALLTLGLAVPRGERLHLLPMVPLYGFYVLFLIVPISLGYLNWLSLRVAGRRVFRDHYQDEASLRARHQQSAGAA
jgi:cellulose synthase/poly-beta-1,6-N-acetylglucosamine synthase-like glycosyltransferase